MIIINGWTVLAHALFLDQVETLAKAAEKAKAKDPQGSGSTANAKTLAATIKLIGQDIPGNPGSTHFRQGDTLGSERRHWFRAKFGNGRFRLFFRFDTRSKTIIYAWVNDEDTTGHTARQPTPTRYSRACWMLVTRLTTGASSTSHARRLKPKRVSLLS